MTILSANFEREGASPGVPDDVMVAFAPDTVFLEEVDSPEGLRALVPRPAHVRFEELAEESTRHRVLILRRGAVIAVTTLVSIGGAFLLHSLIGGVFVLGMLFGFPGTKETGLGSGGDAASEGGSGYLISDDRSTSLLSSGTPTLAELLGKGPSEAAIPQPSLPALPEASAVANALQALTVPPSPENVMPDDLGKVKVSPVRPVAPSKEQDLAGAPPVGTALASVAGASVGKLATGEIGGEGEFSGEPVFSLFKGDGGEGNGRGAGAGRGRGSGRGIDRGPSGADRPEPVVLDDPMPSDAQKPSWLRYNPPKQPVVMRVLIQENGSVGEITIVGSSGRPEVDSYYREIVSKWKFAPAIVGGKPVARAKDMTFDAQLQ